MSIQDSWPTIPPVHPAGWPFMAVLFVIALVLGLFYQPLMWLGLILTGLCAIFFRDPERVPPEGTGLVLAPADGRLAAIVEENAPEDLGEPEGTRMTRLSIVLAPMDVHVNRIPCDAVVESKIYHPGAFISATLDKSSHENERMTLRLRLTDGRALGLVQIAGWLARRIVCDVEEGKNVKSGERYGMIRFGSRVDVWLPLGIAPHVRIGQTMVAGETIMAQLKESLQKE